MSSNITYILHEWGTVKNADGNSPDSDQLNDVTKAYVSYKTSINKNRIIGDLSNRSIDVINNSLFNGGNNVGIIEASNGIRLELKPKFDRNIVQEKTFWTFLPKMLSTLSDFSEFNEKLFLDPDSKIILPFGLNYVPLLALSFISLCDKVLKVGLLRRYVKKSERLKTIKGKIDFQAFAKSRPWEKTTIPCQYYDLTIDNIENQIILWCSNRLINSLKLLDKSGNESYVSRRLREQYVTLSQEITLRPVNKTDVLRANFHSIAPHYSDLMNLCKAILEESLFSFNLDENKMNKGVNFVIDMDWVFEQYMTYLFQKAISLKDDYKEFSINSQYWRYLCDKNSIKIKPDLILLKNEKPFAIIDFKWKSFAANKNADYYQVICYALAEIDKTSDGQIQANLFSVSEDIIGRIEIDTISTILKNNHKISIGKIPLSMKIFDNENPQIVENNIMNSINTYLDTLL